MSEINKNQSDSLLQPSKQVSRGVDIWHKLDIKAVSYNKRGTEKYKEYQENLAYKLAHLLKIKLVKNTNYAIVIIFNYYKVNADVDNAEKGFLDVLKLLGSDDRHFKLKLSCIEKCASYKQESIQFMIFELPKNGKWKSILNVKPTKNITRKANLINKINK